MTNDAFGRVLRRSLDEFPEEHRFRPVVRVLEALCSCGAIQTWRFEASRLAADVDDFDLGPGGGPNHLSPVFVLEIRGETVKLYSREARAFCLGTEAGFRAAGVPDSRT
ncbi:hypothetical protein [Terrabacter sp. Soil811]|uniref:hypothetical protein n=1 Tax=Terrabacter sp. Soil811 TaxID=1736419 RepID=UPI0012E3B42E|nr:hypothetical protein [Terrabacter sp. Soil811]